MQSGQRNGIHEDAHQRINKYARSTAVMSRPHGASTAKLSGDVAVVERYSSMWSSISNQQQSCLQKSIRGVLDILMQFELSAVDVDDRFDCPSKVASHIE